MIVNEPKGNPTNEADRRELARLRAVAKLEQTAVDAELEAMAREDEERAKAAEAAAEAARQTEMRKVQAMASLQPKYARRQELAIAIRDLVSEFVAVEVELRREQDQIVGRPKRHDAIIWPSYVAQLRLNAGLRRFHFSIGTDAPQTYGQSVGLAVVRGIVEDLIGAGWVRVGQNRTEFDFSQGA